jgi:hypothetical protein
MSADPSWLRAPRTERERKFAEFHANNPHLFLEFEGRAMRALRDGWPRIGVKAIAEAIRWDYRVRTRGDDFKINNSFVALYARLLLHRRPELGLVIETRQRKVA